MPTLPIALAATGEIVPAVAGKAIRVHALHVQVSDTTNISLTDNSGTPVTFVGPSPQVAGGGFFYAFNPGGYFQDRAVAGKSLRIVSSASVTIGGSVEYSYF